MGGEGGALAVTNGMWKARALGERWGRLAHSGGNLCVRTAGTASSGSSFLHEAIIGKNIMPYRKRSRLRWYGIVCLIVAKDG
jgi:hypothetical protein